MIQILLKKIKIIKILNRRKWKIIKMKINNIIRKPKKSITNKKKI